MRRWNDALGKIGMCMRSRRKWTVCADGTELKSVGMRVRFLRCNSILIQRLEFASLRYCAIAIQWFRSSQVAAKYRRIANETTADGRDKDGQVRSGRPANASERFDFYSVSN